MKRIVSGIGPVSPRPSIRFHGWSAGMLAAILAGAMQLDSVLSGLAGGALIGAAASLLLFTHGRVAGISGAVGGLLRRDGRERDWRLGFLLGLVLAGVVAAVAFPAAVGISPVSLPLVAAAGVLVGFGTRLGNGCTSGHGVCGLSRLSRRSLVATMTFMGSGALTVLLVRHLGGWS
jgi:uncharacterized protein